MEPEIQTEQYRVVSNNIREAIINYKEKVQDDLEVGLDHKQLEEQSANFIRSLHRMNKCDEVEEKDRVEQIIKIAESRLMRLMKEVEENENENKTILRNEEALAGETEIMISVEEKEEPKECGINNGTDKENTMDNDSVKHDIDREEEESIDKEFDEKEGWNSGLIIAMLISTIIMLKLEKKNFIKVMIKKALNHMGMKITKGSKVEKVANFLLGWLVNMLVRKALKYVW